MKHLRPGMRHHGRLGCRAASHSCWVNDVLCGHARLLVQVSLEHWHAIAFFRPMNTFGRIHVVEFRRRPRPMPALGRDIYTAPFFSGFTMTNTSACEIGTTQRRPVLSRCV
jgi:hypothetical protein